MLPSRACVNVILSARSEPASGAHGPALREASLRAAPTGLPCAKRACERSPRVPPQDDAQLLHRKHLVAGSVEGTDAGRCSEVIMPIAAIAAQVSIAAWKATMNCCWS